MILSLNIKWNGRVSTKPTWEQIIRLGWPSTAGGCKAENSRYPSIWIDNDFDYFHISLSNDGNCGYGYTLDSYPIQPHATYAVYIQFDNNHIFATINGTMVLNETRSAPLQTANLIGSLMNVYIASDSMNPNALVVADVSLSDIHITAIHNVTAANPTVNPTVMPTINPSDYPSFSATYIPAFNPSVCYMSSMDLYCTQTIHVSWII